LTYLAVQLSLYLVCAALIGIALGWCIWGHSKRRQLAAVRNEMATALEAERNLVHETRRDLEKADSRLNDALTLERANSAKAVGEIREQLDVEKQAVLTARSELEQVRADMELAMSAEKATAADTIREAMESINGLKDIANQAKARETQTRAELEEMRLMAGAERLAAQTARSESLRIQREMESSIEVERNNHVQAQKALADIRTTLARTLGDDQDIAVSSTNLPDPTFPATMDLFDPGTSVSDTVEEGAPANVADAGNDVEEVIEIQEPAAHDGTITVDGIDTETAFDVQGDQGGTGESFETEEQAQADGLSVVPADEQTSDHQQSGDGDRQDADLPVDDASQPVQLRAVEPTGHELTVSEGSTPPELFYRKRPEEVDDLQAIDGIDAEIETQLNNLGCYQFKQLANASTDDVDWLALQAEKLPDLRERLERDDWIGQARELLSQKYAASSGERSKWWSRRRLR